MCVSKTDYWTNPTNIRNEFPIERTAEKTLTLYQQLLDDGNINIRQGDFHDFGLGMV